MPNAPHPTDAPYYRDLVAALDALPVKELTWRVFYRDGCVCAAGALAKFRTGYECGIRGIPNSIVNDIIVENDRFQNDETPTARLTRMRAWAVDQAEREEAGHG